MPTTYAVHKIYTTNKNAKLQNKNSGQLHVINFSFLFW